MTERVYHIGFLRQGDKITVQARRNVDYLDCEIWRYEGRRITTKRRLYQQRFALLAAINQVHGTAFTRIEID